ncbi:hypothetical protein [Actinopolymorpha sp. B9G3]|uniref:hypothetical protein n=1 Tax=Actinopolymorpha sp. B9G3 TaxID=3158970 RepID=UPI0032D93AD9
MSRHTAPHTAGRYAVTLSAVVAVVIGLFLPITSAGAASSPRQNGDLLIVNHSFEDGLTGWTPSDGQGEPLKPGCSDVARTGTAGTVDGAMALQLTGHPPCVNVGMVSRPVDVNVGWEYTAYADVSAQLTSSLAIRWLDVDGRVISRSVLDRDRHTGTMRVTGAAPAGSTTASVEVGALGRASFDRVRFTARATVVGPQVSKPTTYLSSTAGVDENGDPVVWGVGSGSATSPAVLVQVDPLTQDTERVIELPNAEGGWTVKQAPDGTVYVGTYGSAALWSYTPGDSTATRIGPPPFSGTDVLYAISIDENSVVYGGIHSADGGGIWRFTPGEGFGIIGPRPLSPGDEYTRSGGYDPLTRSVIYGTGTGANMIACSVDGAASCVDLIGLTSPEVQTGNWTYGMTVDNGYAFAWIGPGNSAGEDYLVIFALSRASDGTIHASVLDEIKGVVYNGASQIHDGKVYYNKAPSPVQMFSYDLATGTETHIEAASPSIYARSWDFTDLQDEAWPGRTLVGMSSNGTVQLYNPQTGESMTKRATNQPVVSIGINSIVGGPDGRIWSSGYLVGGIGAYMPMRGDQHQTWSVGGQAEGMTSHAGRVWQGIYPSGTIQSLDPTAATPTPTVNCTIEPHQSRPYGMLGHGDRIYWGTMADYGETAGAFGYYDLKAKSCTTVPGVGDQTVVTIAATGSKVYAGTMIYGGLNSTPKEEHGTVLRYDESTGEAERIPLPVEVRSVNAAVASSDGTVWFFAEGWLLGLDSSTDTWTHRELIFPDKAPREGARISAHYAQMIIVDGTVYGNAAGRVFGFDPEAMLAGDGEIEVVYDGTGGGLTTDEYGNLYTIWNATSLLRLVV